MTSSEEIRRQDGFAGKGDDFYEALLAAHQGLDEKESAALNARLVLLLANHVGSLPVLREALALARAGVRSGEQGSDAGIRTASKNENKQT
jgi:anthranilate phosphoribosyltransferase